VQDQKKKKGNDCFMNAGIQSLITNPAFVKFFDKARVERMLKELYETVDPEDGKTWKERTFRNEELIPRVMHELNKEEGENLQFNQDAAWETPAFHFLVFLWRR
jgi:hypothetical protein